MKAFSKKQLLVIGAGLLVVLLVIIALVWAGRAKAASVHLSDNKEVSLGESRGALTKTMGTGIKVITPSIYRYPANAKLPTEVVIYMNKDKVSGLLITRNSGNKQVATGATIGTPWKILKSKIGLGSSVQAINTQKDKVKQKGYKVAGLGGVSYYITSACVSNVNERITMVALASQGQEQQLIPLLRPRTCTKVVPAKPAAPAKK